MSEISRQSVAALQALEKVGAINLDVLVGRAEEVRGALTSAGIDLEPGNICYKFTVHIGPHFGDIVDVAAEVRELGFEMQRVR
jgi:hypothetical protein